MINPEAFVLLNASIWTRIKLYPMIVSYIKSLNGVNQPSFLCPILFFFILSIIYASILDWIHKYFPLNHAWSLWSVSIIRNKFCSTFDERRSSHLYSLLIKIFILTYILQNVSNKTEYWLTDQLIVSFWSSSLAILL